MRNPDKIAFRCPLFVLGSVKDYICNFRRLSENFPRWKSPEKRLYVFEEGGHEILIGPQKMESAAVIAEWIIEKLKMAPPFGSLTRLPQQSQHEIQLLQSKTHYKEHYPHPLYHPCDFAEGEIVDLPPPGLQRKVLLTVFIFEIQRLDT